MKPRSDPSAESSRGDRRSELLESLEEVFLKEGFRAVTIAELATRMRCSRRTFYDLAPSKQELFLLVLDRLLSRIRALGDEAAQEVSDPGERLKAFLRPGFMETLQASNAFFDDIGSFPRARRMMEAHQASRAQEAQRIIEDGVRRGRLRPVNPYLVSEAARVVARRLKEPEFLREASVSASEAFREWTDLLLGGLLIPASERPKPRRPRKR